MALIAFNGGWLFRIGDPPREHIEDANGLEFIERGVGNYINIIDYMREVNENHVRREDAICLICFTEFNLLHMPCCWNRQAVCRTCVLTDGFRQLTHCPSCHDYQIFYTWNHYINRMMLGHPYIVLVLGLCLGMVYLSIKEALRRLGRLSFQSYQRIRNSILWLIDYVTSEHFDVPDMRVNRRAFPIDPRDHRDVDDEGFAINGGGPIARRANPGNENVAHYDSRVMDTVTDYFPTYMLKRINWTQMFLNHIPHFVILERGIEVPYFVVPTGGQIRLPVTLINEMNTYWSGREHTLEEYNISVRRIEMWLRHLNLNAEDLSDAMSFAPLISFHNNRARQFIQDPIFRNHCEQMREIVPIYRYNYLWRLMMNIFYNTWLFFAVINLFHAFVVFGLTLMWPLNSSVLDYLMPLGYGLIWLWLSRLVGAHL